MIYAKKLGYVTNGLFAMYDCETDIDENSKKYFINLLGTTCFPSENIFYSVRVYDRALSDDEVIQNFNINKMGFNLED